MTKTIIQTSKQSKPILILLAGIILLFFFGDVTKKIARLFNADFLLFTRVSKAIGLLAISFFVIKYKSYKKKYARGLIYCLIILTFVFVLSNIFLLNIDFIANMQANLDYFVKACFLPLFLIPFFSIDKEVTKKTLIIIQYIFWVNCVAIILGYCFEIEIFETYNGSRFGYMGFLDRSTYSSYLFIFIIIYYYFNYVNSNQIKYFMGVILAIFVSLFVGTKRIYFFLILFGVFHFFYFKLYRNKWFWILTSAILLGVFFFLENLLLSFQVVFVELISIYHDRGVLSAITSLRNDLLVEYVNKNINDNWSFYNYIFGGGFFHEIRPELDIIDSYLFFGIFGPIIYGFLYVKYIFNFKMNNPVIKFLVVVLILLGFFSSGVIFSANFAILIISFSSFFYFESLKETNIET